MDGEGSYESDLSESWSLIDINLNEESVTAVDALSIFHPDKNPSSGLENKNIKKSEILELDYVKTNNKETETASSRLSDINLPVDNHESFSKESDYSESRRDSDEGSKNDSCDSESIEILELDGNYRDAEIDRLDISFLNKNEPDDTYHSDDEESFQEENFDKETSSSDFLRKRRRKLSGDEDHINNSVNSENSLQCEIYNESEALISQSMSYPVYKHYRNNVANTILSLSVGVIFAGVACIAIGHFLGVHDAGETAAELMETLKKLQLENVALQSRLSHLNKAFAANKLKSNLGTTPVESLEKRFCLKTSDSSTTEKPGLNLQSLPDFPHSGHLVEWLSKLQNVLSNRCKQSSDNWEVSLNKIEGYIHDQLNFLKSKAEENTRILENSESKISKILQKMVEKLSSKQDSIEILYRKLVKLKDKLNKKLSEIFPHENFGEWEEYAGVAAKEKSGPPVTESDLLSTKWSSRKSFDEGSSRNIPPIFQFPQPEEYYVEDKGIVENRKNSTEGMSTSRSEVEKTKHEEGKKRIKKNNEKGKKKENKGKVYKAKMMGKAPEKKRREGRKDKKGAQFTLKKNRGGWNETKPVKKERSKTEKVSKQIYKDLKQKSCRKKHNKKSKSDRVFVASSPKNSKERRKNEEVCPYGKSRGYGSSCVNLTGNWVFKWASGRQESRRDQVLGDWQFDRAKARKQQRTEDLELNWQFERAKARKQQRTEDFGLNWQFRRALARESDRNDDRWYYQPYRIRTHDRYHHEGFSWI